MLRAILFDFNGVLVDDEPLHFQLFQRVVQEEGLRLDEDEYYRDYVGYDDASALRAILTRAGESPDPQRLMRLVVRKSSYYQDAIHTQGYPFFNGAVELVQAAASGGLTLGVVTGALRSEAEEALIQAGVRDAFKSLVAAEDVQEAKPDPEGYLRCLQELNSLPPLPERLFHPHEVLAIEDTPHGLKAASSAGLVTLGVAHTYGTETLEADFVADSLEGLTLDWLQRQFAEATRQ